MGSEKIRSLNPPKHCNSKDSNNGSTLSYMYMISRTYLAKGIELTRTGHQEAPQGSPPDAPNKEHKG